MEMYIGLDVHSKHTTYCIQNELGEAVATGEFETTPIGIQRFVEQFEIPERTKVVRLSIASRWEIPDGLQREIAA